MPLRLLPLAIGPAILLPLAIYAFRHRRVRGAIWYCLLLLAIALWSAAYAWDLAAPDGTVVVAVATPGATTVRTLNLGGDRPTIRQYSVIAALEMVRRALLADAPA